MAIGRDARRTERRTMLGTSFGAGSTDAALDVLELLDLAWHDCYGEAAPPASVVDDVLVLAEGDLQSLVRHARLAVIDFRDVKVAADVKRDQA